MWNKVYFGVLSVAAIVMVFFNYYAFSWLQSIGKPDAAVAGYEYHAGLAWTVLWISVVILMIIGNAVLWATGRSWAVWTSSIFFSAFVAIKYFWLDRMFIDYRSTNGLAEGGFSFAPLLAVILIVVMAAIAFFDQFIIVKLRSKTYGEPTAVSEQPAETTPESIEKI